MDRQTLRDWVRRFDQQGSDGLRDIRSKRHPPRLSKERLAELAEIVEAGTTSERTTAVEYLSLI